MKQRIQRRGIGEDDIGALMLEPDSCARQPCSGIRDTKDKGTAVLKKSWCSLIKGRGPEIQ